MEEGKDRPSGNCCSKMFLLSCSLASWCVTAHGGIVHQVLVSRHARCWNVVYFCCVKSRQPAAIAIIRALFELPSSYGVPFMMHCHALHMLRS